MFNHTTLEQDIKRLSHEVSEKKNLPEYKESSEREVVKMVIESLVKPAASASQPTSAQKGDDGSVLPDYLRESPAEVKLAVEKLIDVVFHDGLSKAVKEAKTLNAFILDAFHDALADKLYEELKKRKLI